jgi:UDP-N-acetylglucosamine acyltransferase
MKAHPTSIVDAGAEIADDVEIGPYAIVGAGVRMGAGCRVAPHAVVLGPLAMGERNEVCSFAVLGGKPQIKKREGEGGNGSRVHIGDDNVFREHVTVHRGTESITRIGSHTLVMASAHIAHDVTVGSHCVIANAVQLAGHVVVEDYVTFGGLAGVAQLVVIGESAFVAAGAMVERDVPPYCIVQGDRARVRALNRVGLERRGVPRETIAEIERVFRAVFLGKRPRHEILRDLTSEDLHAQKLLAALR